MDADASGSLDMDDLRAIAENRGLKRILEVQSEIETEVDSEVDSEIEL